MRKKVLYAVLAVAIAALVFVFGEFSGDKKTFDNTQGGMRIVSVSPNITEILFALDLGDNVVGVSDFCDYPAEAARRQSIGSIMEPDIETILSLKPTNVFLTDTAFHNSFGARLEGLGIDCEMFNVEKIDGIKDTITRLGRIADCRQQSRSLNNRIQAGLEAVKRKSANFSRRPRVLVVIQNEPIIAVGEETYIDQLVKIAGADNAAAEMGKGYPIINAETLVTIDPEVIIETRQGAEVKRSPSALTHYRWETKAVKNENVFVVDADAISRPGPRVVTAAKSLQKIIAMVQEDE